MVEECPFRDGKRSDGGGREYTMEREGEEKGLKGRVKEGLTMEGEYRS